MNNLYRIHPQPPLLIGTSYRKRSEVLLAFSFKVNDFTLKKFNGLVSVIEYLIMLNEVYKFTQPRPKLKGKVKARLVDINIQNIKPTFQPSERRQHAVRRFAFFVKLIDKYRFRYVSDLACDEFQSTRKRSLILANFNLPSFESGIVLLPGDANSNEDSHNRTDSLYPRSCNISRLVIHNNVHKCTKQYEVRHRNPRLEKLGKALGTVHKHPLPPKLSPSRSYSIWRFE